MNAKLNLSVIIPVYNVEKYLEQCVESVVHQNLDHYEIILVDDGSTDNSGSICDFLQARHKELKVIHKENGGLSDARNKGLEVAKGEYIIFMDSDDWWNPDVCVSDILTCLLKSPSTEMCLFSSLDYLNGSYFKRAEHSRLKNIKTSDVYSYYRDLLSNGNLEVSACTKVLKRSFLLGNSLFFKNGLLGEDNEWMIRLLRVLKHVMVIDEPLYICRRRRDGSITATIKSKNISDLLSIIMSSIKYYKKNSNSQLKTLEFCFCAYLWFCALALSCQLDEHEKSSLKPVFAKTREVCKYSNSLKTKACNILYSLAGITCTSHILSFYLLLKNKFLLSSKNIKP